MNPSSSDLTSASIPALIRRLAIPAGTGFFFNTMFNVVDTWYGGKLSTTALAAMSLSFPVFFILLAVGAGVSSGATALIGSAIGKGQHDEAERYLLQSISFALLNALLLAVAGLLFSPMLFRLMGAEGEYLSLALSYMNIIFAAAPFFMFNFIISAILNAHGNTITYRNFLIIGFVLNLLLDPWFMYGGFGIPPLGLAGVALSTVLIQVFGNFHLFRRLLLLGIVRKTPLSGLLPVGHYYRELAKQGFPTALNMMTVTLGIFIITWFAGRYGKEVVAAYGIGTRIEQLALLPVMGLNVSTLALTAQNFGANRPDRIRQVLLISLRYGFMLASAGTVAGLLFGGELMAFFTTDSRVIAAGTGFLKIEAFVLPAYVLLYVCVSVMQGIKRPSFALLIGLYRQIAAPLLLFYLLTTVFAWGAVGIWWGILITTWSAALIVVGYVTWILKKLEEDRREPSI